MLEAISALTSAVASTDGALGVVGEPVGKVAGMTAMMASMAPGKPVIKGSWLSARGSAVQLRRNAAQSKKANGAARQRSAAIAASSQTRSIYSARRIEMVTNRAWRPETARRDANESD